MRLPFKMPGMDVDPTRMALQSALESPEVPPQQPMLDPAMQALDVEMPHVQPSMEIDPYALGGMVEDTSPYIPNPRGMDAEQQGIPQPGTTEFYDWLMGRSG